MKSKFLSFVLASFVIVGLAACGETPTTSSTVAPTQPTTAQTTTSEVPTTTVEPTTVECEHEWKKTQTIAPTEEADGKIIYTCDLCGGSKEEKGAPILNEENYTRTYSKATCRSAGGYVYSNKEYGSYFVEKEPKTLHSTYGGICSMCGELIDGLCFERDNRVRISTLSGGYPRLYKLKDGSWLAGSDNGRIMVSKSYDEGETWERAVKASFHDSHTCANVDFFELENGDIIVSYRAIGGGSDPNFRGIFSSISHDGGETFEAYNEVVCNYNMGYPKNDVVAAMQKGYGIGFYEPYVDLINGIPTVMYADDFSPMVENVRGTPSENYKCQYLMSKQLINDEWVNPKIIMNGAIEKTVSGITRTSRDGMPVFAQMHNGTYVTVFEGTYRDSSKYNNIRFEILMTYSKDGINWSNPVEIFTPYGNGTKASAPFVCVTDDDRLVVSFQTDEDCFMAGKGVGDAVSIMKTMISDGTPVEEITARSFHSAQNVFETKPGGNSMWNGMMYHNNTIYCISGTDGGIYYNTCEIPEMTTEGSYSKVVGKPEGLTTRCGELELLENGLMRTTNGKLDRTLAIDSTNKVLDGTIELSVIPKTRNDCGLIFRCGDQSEEYWEKDTGGYYALLVNERGMLLLGKVTESGSWKELGSSKELQEEYDTDNVYNLKVELDGDDIICSVNGEELITVNDTDSLQGTAFGFRSAKNNTIFANLKSSSK